jgi:hypothetical protein
MSWKRCSSRSQIATNSCVHARHLALELGDRLGVADAGDDVLALGVHQVVAEEDVLAGVGVAGERDAGARADAHVAEHDRLDVDGGAEVVADAGGVAVVDGALAEPAVEHGAGRELELLEGILREGLAGERVEQALEALRDAAPGVGVELDVERDARAPASPPR